MTEIRRHKRFDLFSTLAIFGVLLVLLFQSFFVFELYNRKIEWLSRLLPADEEPVNVQEEAPLPDEDAEPVG